MTAMIWLIAEGHKDIQVARQLLQIHASHIEIRSLGRLAGIEVLVEELEEEIKTTIIQKGPYDCIAVMYDLDEHTEPRRETYNRIEEICHRYSDHVYQIRVRQKIEAWILADQGFAEWIGERHQNWDEEPDPKQKLGSLLDRHSKPKFQGSGVTKVLDHLNGNTRSESLKATLSHLENAPCTRS
jgi:hypothetical protein